MEKKMPRESVEFNLEKTLTRTADSENLVRNLVTAGERSDKIDKTIQRNVNHMKIIIAKQQVIDSGSAKIAEFQEAITLGETFVAG